MTLTRTSRLICIAAMVALFAAVVPPAEASVSGSLTFQCTATYPFFPNSGPDTATCGGSAVVSKSGLDDAGSPYSVEGAGNFAANYTYVDNCNAGGPPLIGTAQGTMTTSGVSAVHNGALTTANISMAFSWTRVGTAIFLVTGSTRVTFGNGGTASSVAPNIGAASWVPFLNPSHVGCPTPFGPPHAGSDHWYRYRAGVSCAMFFLAVS